MKNNNYVTIQGWMVNELKLSGNDLICYAIIYGFSQDDNYWEGSQSYLSEWMGITRRCAIDILNRLTQKGYLDKQEYEVNKVKFCKYKAVVPEFSRCEYFAQGGSEESSQCIYNIDNNKEERDKSLSKKDDLFEECWKTYRRKGNKKNARKYWDKLSADDKKKVLPHIKAYCSSRELNYQKDFERYLRDRIFENIIVKGNTVIFDPSMGASSEYNPVAGVDFFYNDFYKTWMYIGYDTSFIPDGYNADNRPNGARVTLNNARGVLVWNATDKKWEKE